MKTKKYLLIFALASRLGFTGDVPLAVQGALDSLVYVMVVVPNYSYVAPTRELTFFEALAQSPVRRYFVPGTVLSDRKTVVMGKDIFIGLNVKTRGALAPTFAILDYRRQIISRATPTDDGDEPEIKVIWDRHLFRQAGYVEKAFSNTPEEELNRYNSPVLLRTQHELPVPGLRPGSTGNYRAAYALNLPPFNAREKTGAKIEKVVLGPNTQLSRWIHQIPQIAHHLNSVAGAGLLGVHRTFSADEKINEGSAIVNSDGELVMITLENHPGTNGHGVCAYQLAAMASETLPLLYSDRFAEPAPL